MAVTVSVDGSEGSPSTTPNATSSPATNLAMRTRRGYLAPPSTLRGDPGAQQPVGDAVDERLPRSLDDVAGHPEGLPRRLTVARLDQDPGDRVRAVRRVDDPHAVVDELEFLQHRVG